MTPELIALGRRIVAACERLDIYWDFDGAKWCSVYGNTVADMGRCGVDRCYADDSIPMLSDPVTAASLPALIARKAWQLPSMYASPAEVGWTIRAIPISGGGHMWLRYDGDFTLGGGFILEPTELGAWVAAIEVAAGRKP